MAATGNHRFGSFGGTQDFAGIGIDFDLTDGSHRVKMKASDEGFKLPDCPLLQLNQRPIHRPHGIAHVMNRYNQGGPDTGRPESRVDGND